MKQFFKFMFASMVGYLLFTIIMGLLFFIILMGVAASSGDKEVKAPKNSVLLLKLDQPINDRGNPNPMSNFDFFSMKGKPRLGLNDILNSIAKAKSDANIKGIWLDLSMIPIGHASINDIRNALVDFKKSGKFIVSYSEIYSQKAYFLASVADHIYINPEGILDFRGLNAQVTFYKNALKKLDIEAQIIRHGKFKSAVEPFMLDKMSDENKEQLSLVIGSIWKYYLQKISESRNIPVDVLNNVADQYMIQTATDAVTHKLADKTIFKDELLMEVRKLLGIGEKEPIKYITLAKYNKAKNAEKKEFTKTRIAVVYAQGEINSGEGDETTIGSETISKAIREARLDSNVKALVLRVNSPGGSALASDVIWREVLLTKQAKPVVVSMGDVAASGGYYIACAANKIYAEPTTITGSIGVFGMLPNLKGLMNNKLGLTFDNVKTNKYADFADVMRPLQTDEHAIILASIERIYNTFVKHVADGRNMTTTAVDEIGQGRVWSGVDAKKIGLIDEFGGLNDAINEAANLANIKNYRLMNLPKQKDPFQQILDDLRGDAKVNILEKELGEYAKYFEAMRYGITAKGLQARMPFVLDIY